MIRDHFLKLIKENFQVTPIVAILGPRQCGKTTIALQYLKSIDDFPKENFFDLENYQDKERLNDPILNLSLLSGLIVIDEIQKSPNLFETLRYLVDHKPNQRYLILGSASSELIQHSSETLAGRISYLELSPFNLSEVGKEDVLWLRGGFPRSFLAENDKISTNWRKGYVKTYLEKDIPELGFKLPPDQLRRFWMMLAHYHGNLFNASEIGRSLSLSSKTMQYYADILSSTFMIRQLKPWHENIGKRQIKSQKIYFRDSGIFHTLIGINNLSDLRLSPKLGSSWEGFALEQIIKHHDAEQEECYFWSTHQKAELDLLIVKDGKKIGYEFKHSSAPQLSKSMLVAKQDLKLDSLTVIYPGDKNFFLTPEVRVASLQSIIS